MCRRFWIKGLWNRRAAPRYPFEKLLMFVILNNPSDENDWLILPIFPFCDFQLFLEEIAREISNADKEWSIIWRTYFSLVGAHESVELLLEWRWYWDLKIRSISCLSFYLQKNVWIDHVNCFLSFPCAFAFWFTWFDLWVTNFILVFPEEKDGNISRKECIYTFR